MGKNGGTNAVKSWIQTEGGLVAARCWGLDDTMVQQMLLKEADYDAIIGVIDQATRETHGGKFLSYEGKEQPW
jgi:norsolorinic acid ketoreductase